MTTRLLFKVTGEEGASCHSGSGRWPLPTKRADGTWTPGRAWTVDGPLIPCERGLHLCRPRDLLQWLGPVIWTANIPDGVEAVAASDKLVVRTARLERRVETWTERTARHFACDCAERVLHLTTDARSRDAVRIARRFADGLASRTELAAARDAAWGAARDAAWGAAWAAARDAAWGAAWDAAWDAARDAAWGAAWGAAWDAAWGAAWGAEQRWQTERLFHYLLGGQPGKPNHPGVARVLNEREVEG